MALQTATNPKTGEKIALIGGQWVPYTQSATNPETGQKAVLVNEQWVVADSAPPPPAPEEEQSVLRQVADVPLQIGTGIAQGVRFITDAFGADNPVSQTIRGAEGYLQNLLSAQAKEDQQEVARIMQEAEDKGIADQVVAGLKAFSTAPLDFLSQAAGTAAPTIVGGLAGAALRAPAVAAFATRAIPIGIGTVTGAGVVKSTIYDETKQALLEAGATPEVAEERAALAQSYGGENLDQILLGSGIGAFAAGTGLEKAVAAKILGKVGQGQVAEELVERGLLRRAGVGAIAEAAPEAIQAGQEQLAANIALQREGFDVPTMRGVAGAAALEGVAGALLGAGVEAVPGRAPVERGREPVITEEGVEESGVGEEVTEEVAPPRRRATPVEEAAPPAGGLAEILGGVDIAQPPVVEPTKFRQVEAPTDEALEAARSYMEKVQNKEVKFNPSKARALVKDLNYEGVTRETNIGDIRSLLESTLTPSAAPVGEIATTTPAPTLSEVDVTPEAEVSREQAAGVGEVVTGAGARGVELPLSRLEPAGREAAAPPSEGLEGLGVAPDRAVERAGEGAPALETEAPPAPRIFENIETLNRPKASFIDELGRERAPSLRRELSKIKQDYDAGTMTGDQFAETAGNLLLKTQKERIVQPRQRGAEFVRERLFNASRNGYLDPKGVELASWFVQQNPLLVQDLGVSIRQRPQAMEGTAAFYEPTSRIITLFKDAGDVQTATHEILHHTERLMPATIRANILKAYVKQLTKAEKKAKTDAEKQFFSSLTNYQYFKDGPEKDAEYQKAIDAIQNKLVPKSYYQFVNPSEFWAINGARIVEGRYGIPSGVVGQIKKWLREFIEKAKSSLGLSSDAAIIRALDSLAKADGKYKTDSMLREAPGYRAVEPIKGKKAAAKETMLDRRKASLSKIQPEGTFRKIANALYGPGKFENLYKLFQDANRLMVKTQQEVEQQGLLQAVGDGKTNVADQIALAPKRASIYIATQVNPAIKAAQRAIGRYAQAARLSVEDALAQIDVYRIALSEKEKRETLYHKKMPLRNDIRIPFLPGMPEMTPADIRDYLDANRSRAKTDADAQKILQAMRYLAANYVDANGASPVGVKGEPMPTDINDEFYNVIGPEYTQDMLEDERQKFEDDPNKQELDAAIEAIQNVDALSRELNRKANYWTPKVDRVVASYGWKNYAPFKGIPGSDKTMDTDTERLSGELAESEQSMDGRRTEFDSPTMQSFAEAYYAASRAGRGSDLTLTIKNLAELGIIKSKRPKKFEFEDRAKRDFDYDQLRGRNKILHYNEDGSVEVYELKDQNQLEAIKTPYRELNVAWKLGNTITSGLGQLHTRLNLAFPPMDFIRNTLTNASLISAKLGPKKAGEYIAAVAANVRRNGLGKSFNISKALSRDDKAELDRLRKKHPFYNDAIEFLDSGGRTVYRQGFTIADQMDSLIKELGPKKILTEPNQLLQWIDAYNDSFEFTSRVAAYTIRKNENIAKAKAQGLDLSNEKIMEDIRRDAAAFAVNLMDFGKVGKYGREAGAWFMFIRPAATGAVNAIDALRPMFLSDEAAVRRLEPTTRASIDPAPEQAKLDRLMAKPDKKPEDLGQITKLQKAIDTKTKNRDNFFRNLATQRRNAQVTFGLYLAVGAALYGMAVAASDEDEQGRNRVLTDDMSRWTRYLRLPLIVEDGFLQVPWGFGVSAVPAIGAQVAALTAGGVKPKDFLGNMVELTMDSYLPIPASRINPFDNLGAWMIDSSLPSAIRPVAEFVLNIDAMGNPIYNSRLGKYAEAYQGSTRASEIHRDISQRIFDISGGKIDWSPDSIAFLLNNYADGFNHIAENSWNAALTISGDKDFDAKKDTFLLRSFIGRNSNYDAREFAEAEKQIKDQARTLNTLRDYGTPEQYRRFIRNNPNAELLVDIYNKGVNGELRKLRQERNEINRMKNLTPKQREDALEEIRTLENYVKKNLVGDLKAYEGR